MKFSEIERQSWDELKPYFDTAVVPLSGLTGDESPWEATEALERLRDALDPIEAAFKGRTVTYPAVHYSEHPEGLARMVDELCRRLKSQGFVYCVAVAAAPIELDLDEVSLLLSPATPEEPAADSYRERVKREIETLWHGGSG